MLPDAPLSNRADAGYIPLPTDVIFPSDIASLKPASTNTPGQTVYNFEKPEALDRIKRHIAEFYAHQSKFITIGDLLYLANPPMDFPTGDPEYPTVLELKSHRKTKALPSPTLGLHVARWGKSQFITENPQFTQVRQVHTDLDRIIRDYYRGEFDGKLEVHISQ